MCRNIRTLHNFEPPATEDDVRGAALQYVRKISGYTKPPHANAEAFDRAVDEVAAATSRLLAGLVTSAPPKDREAELEKKRAAAANAKPVVTAQLVPRRGDAPQETPTPTTPAVPASNATGRVKSGIERMFEVAVPATSEIPSVPNTQPEPRPTGEAPATAVEPIAVTARADETQHGKTTMPKLAGSYKLPSTALLRRPDVARDIEDK